MQDDETVEDRSLDGLRDIDNLALNQNIHR